MPTEIFTPTAEELDARIGRFDELKPMSTTDMPAKSSYPSPPPAVLPLEAVRRSDKSPDCSDPDYVPEQLTLGTPVSGKWSTGF